MHHNWSFWPLFMSPASTMVLPQTSCHTHAHEHMHTHTHTHTHTSIISTHFSPSSHSLCSLQRKMFQFLPTASSFMSLCFGCHCPLQLECCLHSLPGENFMKTISENWKLWLSIWLSYMSRNNYSNHPSVALLNLTQEFYMKPGIPHWTYLLTFLSHACEPHLYHL